MFGDALTRRECARLLACLSRTRLCFVCAHGRPTAAPIANLESLRRLAAARRGAAAAPAPPWRLSSLKEKLGVALAPAAG
jgi:hypothetical protein